MNFTHHDDYFAHLPKERQEHITAKAEALKQSYELATANFCYNSLMI